MDSQKIKAVIIVFVAAIAALYLGVAAATEQVAAIAWIAAGLGLVFILALGKHVWILIPIGTAFNGGFSFIPGAPALWMLAVPLTATIFLARLCLRRGREFTWRWSLMDLCVAIHAILLAQSYIRNPVGFASIGLSAEMVGGRAYFVHGFCIAGYILLSMVRTNLDMVKKVVICMIFASLLDGFAVLIGAFVPAVAAVGLKFYSGFSFDSSMATTGADANNRVVEGKYVGEDLAKAAFSLYRPMSTFNPVNLLPFCMISFGIVAVLISGFRSVMGLMAIYFVVGSLLRRRLSDVIIGFVLSILAICLLMFTGTEHLPRGAQRVLSALPIPGLVSDEMKASGEDSTEWRVEMWMLALTTDRYIHNKMFGDGFGSRRDEMEAAIDAAYGDRRRLQGVDAQEMMMRRGSYHGFHVQTIRMVGYVGLFLTLVILGVFYRNAWKHIQYFRNHKDWGYVLYIGLPFLIFPFYAMLIFGDFSYAYPKYILMAGVLKMLWTIRADEAAATVAVTAAAEAPRRDRGLAKHPGRFIPRPRTLGNPGA